LFVIVLNQRQDGNDSGSSDAADGMLIQHHGLGNLMADYVPESRSTDEDDGTNIGYSWVEGYADFMASFKADRSTDDDSLVDMSIARASHVAQSSRSPESANVNGESVLGSGRFGILRRSRSASPHVQFDSDRSVSADFDSPDDSDDGSTSASWSMIERFRMAKRHQLSTESKRRRQSSASRAAVMDSSRNRRSRNTGKAFFQVIRFFMFVHCMLFAFDKD
jgi:hypothetical protein